GPVSAGHVPVKIEFSTGDGSVAGGTIRATIDSSGNFSLPAHPPPGDSSTNLATCGFVQSEGMQKVTGIGSVANIQASGAGANRPTGLRVDGTTTLSTSYITALSITGKGVLNFLSAGVSGGTGQVKVTVDGTVLSNLNGLGVTDNQAQYFSRALVGQIGSV